MATAPAVLRADGPSRCAPAPTPGARVAAERTAGTAGTDRGAAATIVVRARVSVATDATIAPVTRQKTAGTADVATMATLAAEAAIGRTDGAMIAADGRMIGEALDGAPATTKRRATVDQAGESVRGIEAAGAEAGAVIPVAVNATIATAEAALRVTTAGAARAATPTTGINVAATDAGTIIGTRGAVVTAAEGGIAVTVGGGTLATTEVDIKATVAGAAVDTAATVGGTTGTGANRSTDDARAEMAAEAARDAVFRAENPTVPARTGPIATVAVDPTDGPADGAQGAPLAAERREDEAGVARGEAVGLAPQDGPAAHPVEARVARGVRAPVVGRADDNRALQAGELGGLRWTRQDEESPGDQALQEFF